MWSEEKQLKHLPRAYCLNFSIPRSVADRWLASPDELECCSSRLHQYGPFTSVQFSRSSLLWNSVCDLHEEAPSLLLAWCCPYLLSFHGLCGAEKLGESTTHFAFSALVHLF
jgi:hypothetical protein